MLLFYALWHNGLTRAKTLDGDVFTHHATMAKGKLEPIKADLVAGPANGALSS